MVFSFWFLVISQWKEHLVYNEHKTLWKIWIGLCIIDTFQDFLIAEHMKPCMHILKISISSQNHVIVRPTKTPKLADKKCAQFYHLRCFKNWSYQKMPITRYVPLDMIDILQWKKNRKIWIIFDIENSLWKSEIGIFCQLILEFW